MNFQRPLLFALALLAGAVAACGQAEEILSFHSAIEVRADGSMVVTEAIRAAAAGDEIKRGIYRDFPQLYRGRWGLRVKTGFRVLEVTRDGAPEPWHTQGQQNGTRIYIGDKNRFVTSGEHTWRLTYETNRQLGFFEDHDELHWNVTGNGWVFPIVRASAEVRLPEGTPVLWTDGYTGPQGATEKAFSVEPMRRGARFATTRPLGPRHGLTIVVAFPKGHVTEPGKAGNALALFAANAGVFLAAAGLLLVLLYYVVAWSIAGRDPEPGTIIPLYEPPKDFSPAAVRYLKRMGYDDKVFTAAVIGLAVKGVVSIRQQGDKYTLERTEPPKEPLLPDESATLEALLGGRRKLELDNTNHKKIGAARDALKKQLATRLEKTHFVRNLKFWLPGLCFSLVPLAVSLIDARELGGAVFMFVWLSIWSVAVTALISAAVGAWRKGPAGSALVMTLFAIPFTLGEVAGLWALVRATSPWVAALFGAGVTMNLIFYHLLKAPTHFGRRILDQIDGFTEYLTVAEEDRLNLENPPTRTPEVFERFLPYALALDVEQQWAAKFDDVLRAAQQEGYQPGWYSGAAWSGAAAGGFASSLGSSFSQSISSAASPPGSSSGGGSSGGSSGGGGGGGGGGGW